MNKDERGHPPLGSITRSSSDHEEYQDVLVGSGSLCRIQPGQWEWQTWNERHGGLSASGGCCCGTLARPPGWPMMANIQLAPPCSNAHRPREKMLLAIARSALARISYKRARAVTRTMCNAPADSLLASSSELLRAGAAQRIIASEGGAPPAPADMAASVALSSRSYFDSSPPAIAFPYLTS